MLREYTAIPCSSATPSISGSPGGPIRPYPSEMVIVCSSAHNSGTAARCRWHVSAYRVSAAMRHARATAKTRTRFHVKGGPTSPRALVRKEDRNLNGAPLSVFPMRLGGCPAADRNLLAENRPDPRLVYARRRNPRGDIG
jgi:hypothetical protein